MARIIDQWLCCEAIFTESRELLNHLDSEHLAKEIFNYKCPNCTRQMRTINDFNLHFLSNHVGHCLKCTRCEQHCIAQTQVEKHLDKCKEEQKGSKNLENNSNLEKSRKCLVCDDKHSLENCPQFKGSSPWRRTCIIQRAKLCYKCFKRHRKGTCIAENCNNCGGTHHVLLCFKLVNSNVVDSTSSANIAARNKY